jgi:hypothetical protein
MLVLSQKNDSIFRLAIDDTSGNLSQPIQVAKLPATPKTLALKYA